MSAFYGSIQGNRGPATRGGSVASGFKSTCQSYDGSVIVEMNYSRKEYSNPQENLMVRISLSDDSSSGWGSKTAFHGSFQELKEVFDFYDKHHLKA